MWRKIIYLFAFLSSYSGINSQNTWTQKANFSGGARAYDAEFTIGHYAFVGLGNNGVALNDFWKWNETTNIWSSIPNYPGTGTLNSTAFTIEGKGYVCLGWTGSAGATDLWRYDTITNTWTQMATFPGVGRYDCEAFVIGHKAYLVAGSISGPPYLQDVWVYDAHTNSWTQKANFPGGKVEETISFAIGNHGYIADGWYPGCQVQMYEYDTTFDSWTSVAPPPQSMGITEQPDSWVTGSKAYVCTGGNCNAAGLRNGWMYDTVTRSWCEFTYIAGAKLSRGNGVAFSINNHGYFCTGQDTNLNYLGDLWEYTPATKINVSDTTICSSASVHFSDSSSYLVSGWNWSFPGGNPSSSTSANPSVNYTSSGTYSVTLIVTACGAIDTVSRNITVTITGGSGGGPIGVQGNQNICSGTSDTLIATGGGTYSWNNGATTSSIIVTPNTTTTYTVQVTAGCAGPVDTSITVNVSPVPVLSVNPSDTICSGQSVSLNVSGATTYIWAPSNGLSCSNCPNPVATPTSNATYIVTGSNGNGCSSTASVNINVSTAPALLPIPDQTICSGDQVTIVAGLSSGSGGTYTWEPGGSTSLTIAVTPTVTTTYTLQYENSCGTVSTTTTVYVNPAPTPLLTADITQGCAPMCIQFRDRSTISSGNIIQWYWSFGNGDTSHVKNPIYCYTEPGTYTITHTAISDDGCSASLKNIQMITIFSRPVANFIYSPQPVTILEPTVQFTDESTDAYGIIHWGWNFGDGESTNPDSSYRYPIHSYGDTGEYCPQLIVVNNKGCIDTITECLDVEPIFTFYIPNAFTPNKDGRNDVFLPKGEYVKNFEMYIFNRWGEELFHSTDINEGWNGTFESKKICQEGTYAYKIWVTDLKNKQHSYVGEFLLIK